MTNWDCFLKRCEERSAVLAAGYLQGKVGELRGLDPSWICNGQVVLKHLRETLQLLRLHRLNQEKLLWNFSQGCLLARSDPERTLCLLTASTGPRCQELWTLFEEDEP